MLSDRPSTAPALLLALCVACDEGARSASALDRPAATRATEAAPRPIPADLLERGERWHREVPGCGVSSPRLLDADGDGVLDVVLGIGQEKAWGAVVAVSGADGELLWKHDVADEVYATACLVEVDDDAVPDVVVGRRVGGLAALVALSGRTGDKLWGLQEANPDGAIGPFHFNTAIPCPDVDGDGRRDVLALQGGGDDGDRRPARAHLVKSDTGRILRTLPMPDGRESFFVPSLERRPDGDRRLVLATGGETLGGAVHSLTFPGLATEWTFDPALKKGFVAGGLLHDFEGDGRRDVVLPSFNGVLFRLDGDSGRVVWRQRFRQCETYVTPGVGRFDDRDDVLDVVAVFSEGRWPNYRTRNVIAWVDGATGDLLETKDRGKQASSSPLVLDVDGDGLDEVLLVDNLSFDFDKTAVECQLDLYSGRRGKPLLATRGFRGYSAATPWVGHMDDDGVLDLVFVHLDNVYRIDLLPVPRERVHWSEYRGRDQDGVVPRRDDLAGAIASR